MDKPFDWPDPNPFLLFPVRRVACPPPAVYAVLDQAYALPEPGRYHLIFAAADQGWIDDHHLEWRGDATLAELQDFYRRMPIFIIEVDLPGTSIRGLLADAHRFDPDAGADGPDDKLEHVLLELETRWKRLEIGPGGVPATLFDNLFGDPAPILLAAADTPPAAEQQVLDESDPLDLVPESTEPAIEEALAGVATVDAVAVYDVGQGGANGLIHDGKVVGYFDFGGGVTSHTKSFPPRLVQFCFCASAAPPIVLSHLDADHWSSAARDMRAYGSTWIMPHQRGTRTKTGFHHRAMVAGITASGTLLRWPPGLSSITVGQVTVWKCNGPGRNGSGLFMTVASADGDPVLLPADAIYDHVLPIHGGSFDAIGVPHHGGPLGTASIPKAPAVNEARLIYSYGCANSYKHAVQPSRDDHHKAGWVDARSTAAVAHSPNATKVRNTEDRAASGTGHVGFQWSRTAAWGSCGLCQLGVDQS